MNLREFRLSEEWLQNHLWNLEMCHLNLTRKLQHHSDFVGVMSGDRELLSFYSFHRISQKFFMSPYQVKRILCVTIIRRIDRKLIIQPTPLFNRKKWCCEKLLQALIYMRHESLFLFCSQQINMVIVQMQIIKGNIFFYIYSTKQHFI